MTPKEKAKELFDKILKQDKIDNYSFIGFSVARKLSLIAVDEIIKEINDNYDTLHSSDRKLFLEEVKKEINKLHLY